VDRPQASASTRARQDIGRVRAPFVRADFLIRLIAAGGVSFVVAACSSATSNIPANTVPARLVSVAPSPASKQASPTANPTPAGRTATVRRGPIADVLLLNGRVGGVNETPLSFTARGTVASTNIQPGQGVTTGQVLVQADSKQLQKDIVAAQASVDSAVGRFKQGQAQAASRREVAIANSEADLRQAQADLGRVQRGASESERQAATASILTARANLDRTQAELARLTTPPDPTAVRAAGQQVAVAQLAVQAAESEQAKLKEGPNVSLQRDAEKNLISAQAAVLQAQTEYDRLSKGPDPYDIRTAQRAIDQATAAVAAAEGNDKTGPARDAAITSAKIAEQAARDGLAKLRDPPPPSTVELARLKLEDAKAGLIAAQERLNTARKGPDQSALDKVNVGVESARSALQAAQDTLTTLKTPATEAQQATAQAAIDGARLALASAETHQGEVEGRPTEAELRPAQDKVAAAQLALRRAQASAGDDGGGPDLKTLQLDIEVATNQLDALKSELEATRLVAPSDGIIAQLLVQPGDSFEAGRTVIVLAAASDSLVRVNLLDGGNPKRVAVDQKASVRLDGSDLQSFDGRVADFAEPAANGDRIALVQVSWNGARPAVGTGARVSITLQQKDNALLLPQRAIKVAGNSRYVESLDGATRKVIPIEVGIISGTDAEILGGVSEGQTFILDAQGSATLVDAPSARATAVPTAGSATAQPATGPATTTEPIGAVPTPTAVPAVGPFPAPATVGSASVAAPLVATAPIAQTISNPGAAPIVADWLRTVIDEQFTNNERGWPSDPRGNATLTDGSYQLRTRRPGQFVALGIPGATNLPDAVITATFHKTGGASGGGYGLIVRDQGPGPRDGVSQVGQFLVFEVGDKGELGAWLRDGDHWVDLQPWTASHAVRPGNAPNELVVSLVGDELDYFVNGAPVVQLQTSLRGGGAGIFIGGDGNQVALDRLSIEVTQ
jgi:multidrug resistance efflux pump